jgi:hypothetical protein
MCERPHQPTTLEKTDLTRRIPERKIKAAFIGAGLFALVGAVWPNTYSNAAENDSVVVTPTAPSASSTENETTFDVCIGEHHFCDRNVRFVTCGTNVEDYIKAQCEKFEFTAPREVRGDGGMCGYLVYHVKCAPRR